MPNEFLKTLSRQNVRDIFDHTHSGIIVYDSKFQVVYANLEAQRIVGRTMEYMERMRAADEERPEDIKIFSIDGREVGKGELTGYRAVKEGKIIKGTRPIGIEAVGLTGRVWVMDTSVPFLDAAGNVVGLAWFMSDITQEVKAKETIDFQHALQMEAVHNVGHEFRTLLGVMKGYADILADMNAGGEIELDEVQAQAVNRISSSVSLMSHMVDDNLALLLASDPLTKRVMVETDLSALMRDIVEEMRPLADKTGRVLADKIEEGVIIDGNPQLMRTALRDLVDNAIKFSREGGEVFVVLNHVWSLAVIGVQDEGIGIDPANVNLIFDRFYQVDGSATRAYGGMGLGLAVVKAAMQYHGARVEVESEIDKGTAFTIYMTTKNSRAGND